MCYTCQYRVLERLYIILSNYVSQFLKKPKCTTTGLFSSPIINYFEVMNTILQSFMYVCFISYVTCGFVGCLAVNKVCNIYQYPVHSVLWTIKTSVFTFINLYLFPINLKEMLVKIIVQTLFANKTPPFMAFSHIG